MKYFWTCTKCYGNEYSESARITHICNSHHIPKKKEELQDIEKVKPKRKRRTKKQIEEAQIEESPKLTDEAKDGESKITDSKLD